MSIDAVLDLLRCPLCGKPFALLERSVRCPTGHSFDLAKQGSLNLLGRAAPQHADTAAMVAARSRFLATGSYDAISDAVREVVADARVQVQPPRVLEVGAGSGYYAARLLEQTRGRGLALDISPYAARRAARAFPRLGAVVADVWAPLPVPDQALDVVLAVFAPRNPAEFARVLAPNGLVVVVTPEPAHLYELREALRLLEIEPGKGDRLAAAMPDELEPRTRRECRYRVHLGGATLVDLVAMGPNAFHRRPEQIRAQVQALALPLAVTVAVRVSAWRRR